MFPVKLFIRILSTDKKIFIAMRSQFTYQTDSVIAHIDRIYYILRAHVAYFLIVLTKNKDRVKTILFWKNVRFKPPSGRPC